MSQHSYMKISLLLLFFLLNRSIFPQTGSVRLINNNNLTVYVDSVSTGDSSFQDITLAYGKHLIQAFDEKRAIWQERGYEKRITIIADDTITLVLEPERFIYLNSTPYNSSVFYKDSLLGFTPLLLDRNEFDRKELAITQTGYDKRHIQIADTAKSYFIDLQNAHTGKEDSPVIHGWAKESGRRWSKEGLAVASIVSGWAAFYFKRRADDYYITYENAGDQGTITNYYDKTNRYDLYSQIALIISVTSLSTYLWLLIRE